MNPLVNIWNETRRYFALHPRPVPPSVLVDMMTLTPPTVAGRFPIVVDVRNIDTFQMAHEYLYQGQHPLVLNMACADGPGGGVARGCPAQEEELFRRSNAHLTHPPEWYPLKKTEMIYSPEVTVIRDTRSRQFVPIPEFKVSMIACAAVRQPVLSMGQYCDDDYDLMWRKIESLFLVGIQAGHDSVVLGALGCGAYQNPPQEVVELYRQAIRKYGTYFRKIGFAILVVHEKDKENLTLFQSLRQS